MKNELEQFKLPPGALDDPETRATLAEVNRRFQSDHLFYKWEPYPKQAELLLSPCLISAMVGANRVGKTETLSYAAVAHAMGFDPALSRLTGQLVFHKTPCRIWASTLDHMLSREVLLNKIIKFIPPGEAEYQAGAGAFQFKNGSRIIFKSCKAGWQSYQGDELDLIINDEEPDDERIFNEQVMRVLSVSGRIMFSFTPLLGSLWLHDVLYAPTEVGFKQRDVFSISAGMVDNPYLPKNALKQARQRYTGDELKIRVEGEYVVSIGNRFFDREKIKYQESLSKTDFWQGAIAEDPIRGRVEMKPIKDGELRIYEKPIPGHDYAMGGDVADGDPLGDWSVLCCIDVASQRVCAVWRGRIDPAELGYTAALLGRYFNDALIAIERNRQGAATLSILKSAIYPSLYAMPDHLKRRRTRNPSESGQPTQDQSLQPTKIGWDTNARTKPYMMSALKSELDNDRIIINDQETLDEMKQFAFLKEATAGLHNLGALRGHDDCVMALAVALMAAEACNTEGSPHVNPHKVKTIEQLLIEDSLQQKIKDAIDPDEDMFKEESFFDLMI